jgi:diguanylate cyclase (GGDEF)-like protein/putative nucleotidyltransferase with HDIG domain
VNVEEKFCELHALLDHGELDHRRGQSTSSIQDSALEGVLDQRLAQARLGLASSLLTALRCKDSSTASHSVRVALACSAWGLALELPPLQRDALEIAALLHDIGKIGVPDAVLLKPGELTADERVFMDRHRSLGLQILESCCASPEVLAIVRHSATWFDGSRQRVDCEGNNLPLGARVLSIANAFDSMTTPQVYRPAMSHERAMKELCDFAGTQFDPQLVFHFAELLSMDQQKLHGRVARRWLRELDPNTTLDWWQQSASPSVDSPCQIESLHQQRLLENMYDGVIFLGTQLQVKHWNRGAERLTGINGTSMLQRQFIPSLLKMRDERGRDIADQQCPVGLAMHSSVQSLRRLIICGRGGRDLAVDVHTIPIVGADGATQGVTVLLHDSSGEASLEDRCQHLYQQAIRDPLTQLANRAEFDRAHALFIEVHRERKLPCSLIICDIDRFKQVNDTYGHLAGDEIIKSFAQLLKSGCHPGDLVARFGGEEFVMLCADCNNASAAARAEQVRRGFNDLSQPALGGKACSASFGVTEIQGGDTVQTMLNRADRALLMAKEAGRNLVVQLGSGWNGESTERDRRWRFWRKNTTGPLLERALVTNVPLDITVEKLRGFVSDQQGAISRIENECVELLLQSGMVDSRRRADRPVPLVVELKFTREARPLGEESSNKTSALPPQTHIQVTIRAKRGRDRRYTATLEQARRVIVSLQSYLMANELTDVSGHQEATQQSADSHFDANEAVATARPGSEQDARTATSC